MVWPRASVVLVVCVAAAKEARAAVDGAALRRVEGNRRRLAALRALDGDLDALSDARRLRGGDGREAFVLGLLAWLAALRLVLQTFVVEEELFAGSPVELLTAVNTKYRAILKLRLDMTPFFVTHRRQNPYSLNL